MTTSEPVRLQCTPRSSAVHQRMASLLFAAKWVRSAICSPTLASRPPLPEAVILQPLGIAPTVLNTVAGDVLTRLAAVSTLLEVNLEDPVQRHRFPAQQWRG